MLREGTLISSGTDAVDLFSGTAPMFEALALFQDLADSDVQWILDNGDERQVISTTVLIEEGQRPQALYVVLQGLVGVTMRSAGPGHVARLGPGEIFGEISLLEGNEASATVAAIENSLLLVLDQEKLQAKLAADHDFAARWYRAIALTLSHRLRERVLTLTEQLRKKETLDETVDALWAPTVNAMNQYKAHLAEVDQQLLKGGPLTAEFKAEMVERFLAMTGLLNEVVGDGAPLDPHVREEMGARIAVEMLPYVLLTTTAERFYSKPRGYAGDFLTIEMIYQNQPGGSQRLGPLLDYCFLQSSSAKAVRNRRGLLTEEIGRTCAETSGDIVRITTLACGPAEELFDLLEDEQNAKRIRATLIDIDTEALAFVRKKASEKKLTEQLRLVEGNLVYLATGRHKLADLPPQDLVYSIGLIDYFNDKWVVKLIDYVHSLLRPGGRLILGNFHPANPDKAFMDYVLNWRLIHRTEEDMHRLFRQSKFGRDCTNIRFEGAGVNMFAECRKE
jgi:CRP-like cAMP-binding protein/SAM-dependent methyltransferase